MRVSVDQTGHQHAVAAALTEIVGRFRWTSGSDFDDAPVRVLHPTVGNWRADDRKDPTGAEDFGRHVARFVLRLARSLAASLSAALAAGFVAAQVVGLTGAPVGA